MPNEILEEAWRVRDEFAKKYNYDMDAMIAALQEMEKRPHGPLVDRRPATSTLPISEQHD